MWLIIAIVALTIVLDQVTKYLVASQMTIGQSIPIIDNFLYITSHRNAGAAWGIFQGKMMFFYLITLAVIAVVIVWMTRLDIKKDKWLMIALALILGGAVGNFIDRVLYQHVVDFIDTYILGYDFPIFNIADMAVVIGVALIIVEIVFEEYIHGKN